MNSIEVVALESWLLADPYSIRIVGLANFQAFDQQLQRWLTDG